MHFTRRPGLKLVVSVALFLVAVIVAVQLSALQVSSLLPGAKQTPIWHGGLKVTTVGSQHAPTDFELMTTSRLPQPLVPVNGKTTHKREPRAGSSTHSLLRQLSRG